MLRSVSMSVCVFALGVGVSAVGLQGPSPPPPPPPALSMPAHVPVEQRPAADVRLASRFDEPIAIEAKSKPVLWQGHLYHLVGLHQAVFHREGDRLTATVDGCVTTFDKVDYRVSVAVFDGAGHLLGASTATCDVQRVWLGYVLTMPRTLEFDFDVSQSYERAASFNIAIAERKVLTPDDWQK